MSTLPSSARRIPKPHNPRNKSRVRCHGCHAMPSSVSQISRSHSLRQIFSVVHSRLPNRSCDHCHDRSQVPCHASLCPSHRLSLTSLESILASKPLQPGLYLGEHLWVLAARMYTQHAPIPSHTRPQETSPLYDASIPEAVQDACPSPEIPETCRAPGPLSTQIYIPER